MRPTWRFISALVLGALLSAVVGREAGTAELPKDAEKLSPEKAVDAWLAVVEDAGQSHVRRNYAEGRIVQMGTAAVPRLLALWKNASEERRGLLAEILGTMSNPTEEGVEALVTELRTKGAATHPNVVRALADRGVARAVPLVLDVLPKASDELRLASLHALGRLADERASDVMVESLDNPDRLVRTTAADGLTRLLASMRVSTDAKKKAAYSPLFRRALAYVEKGATFESRRILAVGLGLVGDMDAVALLRRLVRAETVEMRIAAAGSLAALQAREATGDLAEAARSEDRMLRRTALDALAAIGDPSCVPTLVEILEESPPRERRDIVRVLRQIAGQPLGDDPEQWRRWWEERSAANPA